MRFNRSRFRRKETQGYRPSEADLVVCILRAINMVPGVFAWRQETRGIPKKTKTGWKVDRNPLELGKADIAGCANGKGFVIEVKRPGLTMCGMDGEVVVKQAPGRLAVHQKEWLEDYTVRGGGKAAVCTSTGEALLFMQDLVKK